MNSTPKGDTTIDMPDIPALPEFTAETATAAAQEIAEICGVIIDADIAPDTDLFTYGLTSLSLVRLVGAIDRAYGVRLTAVDIHDHPTAKDLAALIGHRGDRHAHE